MSSTIQSIGADPEWDRTDIQELGWIAIDTVGVTRNAGTTIGSGVEIAHTAAKVSSVISGGLVPISQILGGILVLATAPKQIWDEYKIYRKASKESVELDSKEKSELGKEGTTVAKLGLANQSLYGAMGAGLTSNGIVSIMGPAGANLFGFNAVVGSSAAAYAGGALGAVYTIRGAVVLGSSIYKLHYLNQFENDFKSWVNLDNLDQSQDILRNTVDHAIQNITALTTKKSLALKRRIGEKCGSLSPNATLNEKIDYLAAIDKGIHEKKLQQKISLIIGIAMIIGGIAAVAAIFVTGGLALLIIGLTSAIFFILMESIYACYDSSWVFEKLRNACYTPSAEVTKLIDAHAKLKNVALPRSPTRSDNFADILQESLKALTIPQFFNLLKTA